MNSLPTHSKTPYSQSKAGFDFGCPDNTGVFDYSLLVPPLASLGNADGAAQMQWFVEVDGLNVFRLPVCWQYLVNNVPGGDLYADFIGTYDERGLFLVLFDSFVLHVLEDEEIDLQLF